jgi:ATP-dependent DNA helicase RecQ
MLAKAFGSFEPGLVDAAAVFIRDTWKPKPAPTWVAFVPSRRHPNLVPALAHDLAATLGLPCREVIAKVRDTEEQKLQENSFHQCSNLDGAFEIVGAPDTGPVLLVDDLVDSGWTFTILAMLLRQAGSSAVLPFAMASSRPRDAS